LAREREDNQIAAKDLAGLRAEISFLQEESTRLKAERERVSEEQVVAMEASVAGMARKRDALSGEIAGLEETASRLRTETARPVTTDDNSAAILSALSSSRLLLSEELRLTTNEIERLGELRRGLRTLGADQVTSPA